MKECKHKNIVAYLGTYHRCVPFITGPYLVVFITVLCIAFEILLVFTLLECSASEQDSICCVLPEIPNCGSVWSTVVEDHCRICIMVCSLYKCIFMFLLKVLVSISFY